MGPLLIDLYGTTLSSEEGELLQHPLVGGVVLFSRNYESPEQLAHLCKQIKNVRSLLITVDQEGGRVQRFKEGFTRLPSMGDVGNLYLKNNAAGLELAQACGWIMAAELRAVGVDMSLAPVLDLNKPGNTAIGDRSFHASSDVVSLLAQAVMQGMHAAGMKATGKHFPGHGTVTVDSHHVLPVDTRDLSTLYADDLKPFMHLIAAGIDAVMPAHIVFPAIDLHPVGFSRYWLQEVLRKKLNFTGIIMSDDLNMGGASALNDVDRAEAALRAGCDVILFCNNRAAVIDVLDQLPFATGSQAASLLGQSTLSWSALQDSKQWQTYHHTLQESL